jgi:hypothetical protein
VLSQLADRPTASIPAACGGHAEMTAAYRLFDNERATFDNILEAHADATRQRIAAQSVAILTQDTTEVDLTRPEQAIAGAGPLDGNSRVGALLHLLHAFTPDGTPLGTVRALIEVFFRVLKSGCRVEERRFEALDRLLTCLAVYLIVTCRTLYVCRLGRSCPDLICEAVFEPAEWQAAWKVTQRSDPPRQPPALGEVVRIVAQLGRYVNRKRAAPPGPQTLWLGLQRVHDFALCWQLFGPRSPKTLQDV